MLVPSNLSLTNSAINPRQIAATSSASAVVLYTVPAGRKFVGYIHGSTANTQYTITPSGGTAVNIVAGVVYLTGFSTTPAQLILIAGTIITSNNASPLFINGIESDL